MTIGKKSVFLQKIINVYNVCYSFKNRQCGTDVEC